MTATPRRPGHSRRSGVRERVQRSLTPDPATLTLGGSHVSKARKKDIPKSPQRATQPRFGGRIVKWTEPNVPPPLEIDEHASPELQSLIKAHEALPTGGWPEALAIKDRHGHESKLAQYVDGLWVKQDRLKDEVYRKAVSFPARSYADIATKASLARAQRIVNALPTAAIAFAAIFEDAKRLATAAPSEAADKQLLNLASECESAMAVHKALSAQDTAERARTERAADAAGYHENVGYSLGVAWRARSDFMETRRPSSLWERVEDAHREVGRTAKAVFRLKAKSISGAVARLRIVVALINADELDTWQPVGRDWLAETPADFERIGRGERK
jgi:hypothetical protein